MSQHKKILQKILSGNSDANVPFDKLCNLLSTLGFRMRLRGTSHHIFTKKGVQERINLQPIGNKAKVYQVKQVRDLIGKYNLELKEGE